MLGRRVIGGGEFDLGCVERLGEIADLRVFLELCVLSLCRRRGGPRRLKARTRRHGRVADLDAIGGLARRLVTFGDDDGDDLAIMGDVG